MIRLIDANALKKEINELAIPIYGKMVLKAIDNAPTVTPDMEFAKWVADQIFFKEVEDDLFVELACRKLEKMGLVEKTESEWIMRGKEE